LIARGISKKFGALPVLQDVTVTCGRAEVVGLLGPNGAGKTTLIALLAGLTPATGGSILLGSSDVSSVSAKRRADLGIWYLPSWHKRWTIRDYRRVGKVVDGVLRTQEADSVLRRRRLDSLLDEFDIADVRGLRIWNLPVGERCRLEIACMVAAKPAFVLLDEPVAHVDSTTAALVKRALSTLSARGVGVLVADHRVAEILGSCDRAYILHQGRVLMEGRPEEITEAWPRIRALGIAA
jgi:lipopolysaccharide export system ATP-binding protein